MDNKNSRKKSILKKVLVAVGAFMAADIAGILLLYRRSIKKLRAKDEGQHNQMEIFTLGIHRTSVGKDTDNAFFSSLIGRNKIVFESAPEKNVLIDVCGVLSSITIVVPESAKVVCDVELTDGKLCEELPADENQEGTPTVTITGRMICSTINVERE